MVCTGKKYLNDSNLGRGIKLLIISLLISVPQMFITFDSCKWNDYKNMFRTYFILQADFQKIMVNYPIFTASI